jgi:hypothetical protein
MALFCTGRVFGQSSAVDPTAGSATAGAGTPDLGPIQAAAQAPQTPAGRVHIVPFGRNSANAVKGLAAPAGAHLTYWGGPVISKVHVVAVFWGPNINTAVTGGIGQFFTDITNSRFYDLLTEYSTTGILGAAAPAVSTNQSIVRGQFDGAVTIAPSICPGPTVCTVTDTQVQTELAAQITAGHLPQPLADATGNIESLYVIYFPPGVTIQLDPQTKSCVQFCAYHSNTLSNITPKFVPYGVLPDFAPPSGCANGCGTGTIFQNTTAVTSHEMSEAVTDALVGSAPAGFAPPLAWYDFPPDMGEIGDLCGGQDATVNAGGNPYTIQSEFSNLQGDCVSSPPGFDMVFPTTVSQGVASNLTLTIRGSLVPLLPNYVGTVHFTSSDSSAVLPADYTFTAADSGAHTFSITLNTVGSQTVSAVDVNSGGFNGTVTAQAIVNSPDLTVTSSHFGVSFVQGLTGGYNIIVGNGGALASSGTVTVTDTVPAGLTATLWSGTGWTCSAVTANPLTCTRADALPAGNTYPQLALNVNVAANAPASVTNTATVSGGGDTTAANNTSNDVTKIVPQAVDLNIAPLQSSGSFAQGQNGGSYLVGVANQGNVSSSGTVTVTNTLSAGLTATAISGPGWTCTLATLSCTRADALPVAMGFAAITVTFNVSNTAPANSSATMTVSGGGDAVLTNNTATFGVIVNPAIAIALTGTGTSTVAAGSPATYGLSLTLGPVAGTVTFACSGLPKGAACSFSPTSLTASGTETVTITTTSRAGAALQQFRLPGDGQPLVLMFVLAFATLAATALNTKRTRRRLAISAAVVLLFCAIGGCGGGGTTTPPPTPTPVPTPTPNPNGTPVGTYGIIVTATGASSPATQVLTLVIN